MDTLIVDEVVENLKLLPLEFQQRVLDFTRALKTSMPRGIPGQRLLSFAGSISAQDVELMKKAIEQGCERVDADEWWVFTGY